jgi:hypothetical protein
MGMLPESLVLEGVRLWTLWLELSPDKCLCLCWPSSWKCANVSVPAALIGPWPIGLESTRELAVFILARGGDDMAPLWRGEERSCVQPSPLQFHK